MNHYTANLEIKLTLPNGTTETVFQPRHSQSFTLDHVTISWGRNSLISAPANRRCKLRIIPPTPRNLNDYTFSKLSVTCMSELLFEGTVTDAATALHQIDGSYLELIEINATESHALEPELSRFVEIQEADNANKIIDWAWFPSKPPYSKPDVGIDDTGFEVREHIASRPRYEWISGAVARFPNSYPIWLPGFRSVICSVWNASLLKGRTTNTIDASRITINRLQTNLDQRPFVLSFGAISNNPDKTYITNDLVRSIAERISDEWAEDFKKLFSKHIQPILIVEPFPYDEMDAAFSFIDGQHSAPISATIIVPERQTMPSSIKRTWESPDHQIKIKGIPTGKTSASNTYAHLARYSLLPIGGTLTFTEHRMKHDLNLIWGIS